MTDFTKEMLDAIEAVKGSRDKQLWDQKCVRYWANNKNEQKDDKKPKKG